MTSILILVVSFSTLLIVLSLYAVVLKLKRIQTEAESTNRLLSTLCDWEHSKAEERLSERSPL